jgi:hypothetical protein
MAKPQQHALWDEFCAYAREVLGYDPDDKATAPEDWAPWWKCFEAGVNASLDAQDDEAEELDDEDEENEDSELEDEDEDEDLE